MTKNDSESAGFAPLGPVKPGDTNGDGIVDQVDLSNMVDWIGIKSDHPDWNTLYSFFDFNNNGEIDIHDVAYVAKLVK